MEIVMVLILTETGTGNGVVSIGLVFFHFITGNKLKEFRYFIVPKTGKNIVTINTF
jgi:hypothetical protein